MESLKAYPDGFGSTYEEQIALPKLMFEQALEHPIDRRFLIGALDQGKIIGICGFVPGTSIYFKGLENAGTLIQMYVKSKYSGRKIGFNLVKTLVAEAFKIPEIDHIVLGVRERNTPAIRVYEQAGFRVYKPVNPSENVITPDFRKMILSRDSHSSLSSSPSS